VSEPSKGFDIQFKYSTVLRYFNLLPTRKLVKEFEFKLII
jgi:hypothetical protein